MEAPFFTLAFVDEVAPEHDRTSCTDDVSKGNEYFNETGAVRCVRCAFLHRLKNGEWPHGAKFRIKWLEALPAASNRSLSMQKGRGA